MAGRDDLHALLRRYQDEYERADELAAEVNLFQNAASIPAHNELRNAGKHLLDALDVGEGRVADAEALTSAINHCRRAATRLRRQARSTRSV